MLLSCAQMQQSNLLFILEHDNVFIISSVNPSACVLALRGMTPL